MRRLTCILILNLILNLSTDAQVMRRRVTGAVAPAQKLLDAYPNAIAAWSFRKLRDAYAGSAIRVRRSSDDTQQDIGFDANGNLDTASLKTFVGANNAFVVTQYDQSGNGVDATTATTADQPRIMASGVIERQNGRPTAYADVSDDLPLTLTIDGNYSVFAAFNCQATTGAAGAIILDDMRLVGKVDGANQWGTWSTSYKPANTDIRNSFAVVAMIGTTGSGGTFYLAGSSDGTYDASTGSSTKRIYGTASSQGLVGYLSEVIVWQSDQTANVSGITSNISAYYTP